MLLHTLLDRTDAGSAWRPLWEKLAAVRGPELSARALEEEVLGVVDNYIFLGWN